MGKNNEMRNNLILILFCIATAFASAQSYSSSREKFTKDFQKLLSEYGKSDVNDFIKKEFTPMILETTNFSDEYFNKMVETCNLMEAKRLKTYPEIYNYVFSVFSFVKAKQPENSYQAWHSSVDKLLDAKNIKKFEDFIDLSAGFFSERRLAQTSNFSWYFNGGNYVFEFTDKPFIRLEGGDLMCLVPNMDKNTKDKVPFVDSVVVYNTSGVYDPVLKKWEGNGGKITWQKVGLDPTKVFATISKYGTSFKNSTLNIDTVSFTTPEFSNPILGKLSENAFKSNREVDRIFPSFNSFQKQLSIKNIKPNVDYEGGYLLKGNNFEGVGSVQEPALITIRKNDKSVVKLISELFIINHEKIESQDAEITFYLGENDSIFHPGLYLLYDLKENVIGFNRGKSGVSQSPFSDSYHMVDMYVPKLSWNYNQDEILITYDFGMSQEQKLARIESKNFYDGQLYDRLQGLESVHPLVALYNYSYKYDEMVLTEGKAASALGKTIEQAKSILLELSSYGFITYNSSAKTVIINEKLLNFINAKSGKKDFDNLTFVSDLRPKTLQGYSAEEIEKNPQLKQISDAFKKKSDERRGFKNFGTIQLTTLDIQLLAVDQVRISDPQNAAVFPDESKITVKKNRNFDFTGWVNVGKMEVKTKTANFVYETNKINLIETDFAMFRVKPLREEDGKTGIPMTSAISNIVGEILVDDPKNRAGINKKIVDFPKLIVSNSSKVYYNDPSIYRGAYDSTRFFFTLNPFTMDSLDNFKEANLYLSGELTSAGIFPKFKDSLRIMPDYSFGFSTAAPKNGYDFYGTGAKYNNKIVLSNNGLQGSGQIDFVQSTSISKAFTFLPDSTLGYASFENRPIEQGVEFPDVKSEDAFITYVPRKNILKAASTPKNQLIFFNNEAKLNGTAIVQPSGMSGFGILNFKDANLGSDVFTFKRWDADAAVSNFNLKNNYQEADEDPLSFKTENVNAYLSFKDRKGVFKSNAGESNVIFPVNQYLCKMDLFTWFMDNEMVEMENSGAKDINIDAGLDLARSNFFSIRPDQDSLQFRAPKANFSLKEKTIHCSKTEYIDVADARIYPDSMKVTIRKKAQIEPLLNSKIVANYITKYHTFIEADTKITARRKYTSVGKYPYIDADSTMTMIQMSSIGLDSSFQTIALGKINSDADFKLSSQFDYYGDVKIQAANPLITFKGATRINHSCEKFPKSWMSFDSKIDPKNIQIPVSSQMKTLDGQAISAGIVWRNSPDMDSVKLYPTFLSSLANEKDPIVISATGLLQYNFAAKEYQIGTPEKLINRNSKGNFIALHTESCSLNGDGKIDLGMDYGSVAVESVGSVNYNQSTGETSMNLTMRFDMKVDKNAFEGIASQIKTNSGLRPMDMKGTTIEQAIVEWVDQKAADKFKEEYVEKVEVRKLPKEMESAIVLTGIKLSSLDRSDMPENNGLISTMNQAILVSVFERTVLKTLPIKLVFQQNYSENVTGDKFAIYVSVPGGKEYLFDYSMVKKEGDLKIITTDIELDKSISDIKEDKRKSKNFTYGINQNRAILSIFMRLFGNE